MFKNLKDCLRKYTSSLADGNFKHKLPVINLIDRIFPIPNNTFLSRLKLFSSKRPSVKAMGWVVVGIKIFIKIFLYQC